MKKIKIFIFVLILFQIFASSGFSFDEEGYFQTALKSFSDNFYAASASLFDRFIKEFPKSERLYEAKLYIAKCYYFREETLSAVGILKEIINQKVSPDIADEANYLLGEISFKEKDFQESLLYAGRIIEGSPFSKFYWQGYFLAGKSYLALSNEALAEESFREIIKNSENTELLGKAYGQLFDFYLEREDYSEAASFARNYLKKYPKGDLAAKAHYCLGKNYSVCQKFIEAIANYEIALNLNSDASLTDLIRKELALSHLFKANFPAAKKNIEQIKNEEVRLFSQGIYYFRTNDYLEAISRFELLLSEFPGSKFRPDVYLHKAEMLYEAARFNDAIYTYRYILRNFKSGQNKIVCDKAHYGLGWCYLKSGEFKKAIKEFKNTSKYAANSIVKLSSQIQIADLYQEEGKDLEALEIYSEILKDNPKSIYADYLLFQRAMIFIKMKQLKKASFVLERLQNKFPLSTLLSEGKYYLGLSYFSDGKYQAAENLFKDFIQKCPENKLLPQAHYLYGKCLFYQKKWQEALVAFKGILDIFRDKEVAQLAYIEIGSTYLNLSLPDEAKKTWQSFLEEFIYSTHAATALLYLGGLYEQEGNFLGAEEYYKKVINDFSDSEAAAESLFSLGKLYLKKNDFNKASGYLEQLCKRDSFLVPKAKLYLARIYAQKNQNSEALKIYDELIKGVDLASKDALLDEAYLFRDMKKYLEAADLFRKAIAQGLDSPKIRFCLGLCLEKLNRNKEAIDEYFKAIEAYENEEYKVKYYFRIARLYEKEKDLESAKKIYEKLIDFNVKEAKIAKARLNALESGRYFRD